MKRRVDAETSTAPETPTVPSGAVVPWNGAELREAPWFRGDWETGNDWESEFSAPFGELGGSPGEKVNQMT